MSKIFFDHLLNLEELAGHINSAVETTEEREELWEIIDEIIHHRVLGCVLDYLPHEHHDHFIDLFCTHPHGEAVLTFLSENISHNVEELIRQELGSLALEIIQDSTT